MNYSPLLRQTEIPSKECPMNLGDCVLASRNKYSPQPSLSCRYCFPWPFQLALSWTRVLFWLALISTRLKTCGEPSAYLHPLFLCCSLLHILATLLPLGPHLCLFYSRSPPGSAWIPSFSSVA